MPTVWNPADKSASISLSSGNHIASSTGAGNNGVRASPVAHSSGKYYLEYSNIVNGGSGASSIYGFAHAGLTLGTAPTSAPYLVQNGLLFGAGSSINMGAPPGTAVVCFAVDLDNLLVWCRYDNGEWGGGHSPNPTADPATGVDGHTIAGLTLPIMPYLWLQNSGFSVTLNAGDSAFAQAIPSNFVAWDLTLPPTFNQGMVIF